MVYSKIKVFGCDVCVIPTARDNVKSELLIRERESNLPIGDSELPQMYILPSLSADAETVAASRSEWGHTLSPTVQTAAAAVFMRCTRGLPLDEIEIKSEDEILTAFIDAKNRIISLKMPKCTLKYSNICQNYANCEISSRVYSTKIGNVIVIKCENSSFFSRDAHLSFLYSAAREYVASVSYSIEDNGDGISFNIFIYNVESDYSIDYATGDFEIDPEAELGKCNFVINKNNRKFHLPTCRSVTDMNDSNRIFSYETYDELVAQGCSPCGTCLRGYGS